MLSSSGTPPETTDPIEKFLSNVHPGNEILWEKTAKQLEELGVDDIRDIQFLKETDLIPLLKPVQARKLLAKVQDMDFTQQSKACTPKPHSPSSMESLSAESSHEQGPHSDCELDISGRVKQMGISSKEADRKWLNSFIAPWDRFSPGLRVACSQKRPTHSERLDMVRKLCEAISLYTRLPGRAALRDIAKKIESKYPESFQDCVPSVDEEGKTVMKVVVSGSDSLALQLENGMVNHYSRGHKSLKRKFYQMVEGDKEDDLPKTTDTTKRAKSGGRLPDSYGCFLWQPEQRKVRRMIHKN